MTRIVTNSGQYVDLQQPDPTTLCIEDIAHHLAGINRFTGACNKFYSVAQHSVLVSHLVGQEHAFEALMHDATEAYLGDVSSPLKQLLPEYKRIEENFYQVLAEVFGLPLVESPEVKTADMQAYLLERISLIDQYISNDPDIAVFEGMMLPEHIIEPCSMEEAKVRFMARFTSLATRAVI